MRIGNYQFSPRLLPSLLVMVLLPILLSLGFWQLKRADEKKVILAAQEASMAMPPKVIDSPLSDGGNLEFRQLKITGRFVSQYQVYIDNKIHQGRVGYEVVTPLQIRNSQQYVLVNRGWIPLGESREKLPVVQTTEDEVTLVGLAKYDPKDVAAMGKANRSNTGWPAIVRWIDITQLQSEMKVDLLPFLLLLDPAAAHGFVREWKFVNMPPEKNLSYAVQWFALALALCIIYLVVNTRRIKKD